MDHAEQLSSLARRLRRLERQNTILKLGIAAIGAVFGLGLLMGQAPTTQPRIDAPRSIVAQSFAVTDASGSVRAVLSATGLVITDQKKQNTISMGLQDGVSVVVAQHGAIRVEMRAEDDLAKLQVMAGNEKRAVLVATPKMTSLGMDEHGTVRAMLQANKDSAVLSLLNSRGDPRSVITAFDDYVSITLTPGKGNTGETMLLGHPDHCGIYLSDPRGVHCGAFSADSGGASITLADERGKKRAMLGCIFSKNAKADGATTRPAESALVLWNTDGSVSWKTP